MSRGFVVWLTGLSGAGKTTIARRLAAELTALGTVPEILDGDEVRTNLSAGLGFSKEDRDTNVRRIGYVSRLLARNGTAVIAAAISPYRDARAEVRSATPGFVEVYVRCSLDELVRRDVKGLYQRAIAGEIANFTGVSDPYEAPEHADVVVDTERESIAESVEAVLQALSRLGYIRRTPMERLGTAEDAAAATGLPRVAVNARTFADLAMLGNGALSPLSGFMDRADYSAVRDGGRLASGTPFTIPVLLRADSVPQGAHLALEHAGRVVGTVEVTDVFDVDAELEAAAVYGTVDAAHPGVRLLQSDPARAVAGPITLLEQPTGEFARWDLSPRQVREARDRRGWRTMVGFQTRNPVHRAHEYLHKVALEMIDGLLLHPLVGETKSDDIPAAVRMKCYEALLDGYYPADRTLLAVNPAWMRYAGPREAVFHALVRRNYGCTHFIVGRDHAGVGNYYDTYAAQRIFDDYAPGELGIEALRFEHSSWCTVCGAMVSARTCPHPAEKQLTLSGTSVREMLLRGEDLPSEFTRPEVAAVLAEAAVQQQ